MSQYKIEKGISYDGPRAKYPFDQMDVGDSFFVPVGSLNIDMLQNRLNVSCARRNKTTKRVFRSKRVTEKRGIGVRVWRIK